MLPLPWKTTLVLPLLACLIPLFAGEPNVLIITVDTLRADRLGAHGHHRDTSPAIDRLLAKGKRFDRAYTPVPLTGPAMISMFTSRYPHQHGATRNGIPMNPREHTLSDHMRDQGYQTAAFVSNWTLKSRLTGLAPHFEDYEEVLTRKRWFGLAFGEADASDVSERGIEWLETRDQERPYFLWLHYADPHAPYRYHEEYEERLGVRGRIHTGKRDRYDMEIAFTDEQIGRVLSYLEKTEKPGDTMIWFAADHGESLGEHQYWGHGRHLYEPSLRVPLALVWPGVVEPGVEEAPASLLDVAPTTLSLLGQALRGVFSGRDWNEPNTNERKRPILLQAHRGAVQRLSRAERGRRKGLLEVGMVLKDEKHIWRVRDERLLTFNLDEDPLELTNLGEGRELSALLTEWALQVERGLLQQEERELRLTSKDMEMLRSLGYVD